MEVSSKSPLWCGDPKLQLNLKKHRDYISIRHRSAFLRGTRENSSPYKILPTPREPLMLPILPEAVAWVQNYWVPTVHPSLIVLILSRIKNVNGKMETGRATGRLYLWSNSCFQNPLHCYLWDFREKIKLFFHEKQQDVNSWEQLSLA